MSKFSVQSVLKCIALLLVGINIILFGHYEITGYIYLTMTIWVLAIVLLIIAKYYKSEFHWHHSKRDKDTSKTKMDI